MKEKHQGQVMENEFSILPVKETVELKVSELCLSRAKDFAEALPFAHNSFLINCQKIIKGDGFLFNEGDEMVIFEMAVSVSQNPVHDIRYTERIAIVFTKADKFLPWVFALRKSFPKVLHLNSTYFKSPACLCIYEQSYEELKLEWRSQKFLQDIRTWLELTAEGKLHQDDQPLEPFILLNKGTLILPRDSRPGEGFFISLVNQKANSVNLVATREKQKNSKPFFLLYLFGEVQQHGIIDYTPKNLTDLNTFLAKAGINLFERLQTIFKEKMGDTVFPSYNLLLAVLLPKKGQEGQLTGNDLYSFLCEEDIKSVGIKLNVWSVGPEGLGLIFPAARPDETQLSLSKIEVLTTSFFLSIEDARFLSGYTEGAMPEIKIAQIGLGALGSQLFMNLAKSGFGKWKLIDKDIMLPHNAVRHHLSQSYPCEPKSWVMAFEANRLFNTNIAEGIWDDVLSPDNEAALSGALSGSEIILDVSASIAVARNIAFRKDFKARRVSMFLNPSGSDFIVLAEDRDRKCTLDILEFQYYRALINNPKFRGHLKSVNGIRYSNSCRDITGRIPQDWVAVHAGIASSELKKIVCSEGSKICTWRINQEAGVDFTNIPVQEFIKFNRNGWDVYMDKFLGNKISEARLAKLPNETGGILIGGYDMERKKIYLMDTILSPEDSEEMPDSYIRGKEGLKEKLNEIAEITAGHLVYVGEWHSHPVGCSLRMSKYDKKLFKNIEMEMFSIGYPPLMLICGHNKKAEVYMNI